MLPKKNNHNCQNKDMFKNNTAEEDWTVEVTIQSLEGILLREEVSGVETHGCIPNARVRVAFSGSVAGMQVGSSSVCSRTGQLVVESEALAIDPRHYSTASTPRTSKNKKAGTPSNISTDDSNNYCWLRADWMQNTSTAQQLKQPQQPHLTVPLVVEKDPQLPKATLSKSNRDSFILEKNALTMDEDDNSFNMMNNDDDEDENTSVSSDSAAQPAVLSQSLSRGGMSAIWSNDSITAGDAMPEIVELSVRIQTIHDDGEDDDMMMTIATSTPNTGSLQQQDEVGYAHLVLFGHEEDRGTFVMELPVKKRMIAGACNTGEEEVKAISSSCKSGGRKRMHSPSVVLTDESRLRVKVKMIPPGPRRMTVSHLLNSHTLPTAAMTTTVSSLGSHLGSASYGMAENADDHKDHRRAKICLSPSQVEQQVRSLLRTIEQNEQAAIANRKAQRHALEVEVPVDGNTNNNNNTNKSHKMLCGSLFSWDGVYNMLAHVIGGGGGAGRWESSPMTTTGDAASVDSTIHTRDSMQL